MHLAQTEDYPPEMDNGEPQMHPEVKKFIMAKVKQQIYHDIEYGPKHNRTRDQELHEGIEIMENIEVECCYFHDDPTWYE